MVNYGKCTVQPWEKHGGETAIFAGAELTHGLETDSWLKAHGWTLLQIQHFQFHSGLPEWLQKDGPGLLATGQLREFQY